ncbi:MAG: ammonium transporter [Xenococcaceae cyanobacterium MO_188.B19]|nr:ammonium transporter [Xenococcaceae cyanobacterium MO_188.B19]
MNSKISSKRQQSKGIQYPGFLGGIIKLFSPSWLACIPLTALIVIVWNTAAHAQGYGLPENATPEQIQTNFQVVLDSVFLLIASVLVIFMNAGFGMLETGFCRQKNAVNILSKNLIVFAIATISYWAIGYGLMYGEGNAFIGTQGFFFNGSSIPYTGAESYTEVKQIVDGAEETIRVATAVPEAISFLFQVAFAATAATIVSGAVAERIKYDAFLIFSAVLVAISYPITGHWIWDGGWLSEMGFSDFAGSTAVHSVGGWAALVGAWILGPRLGKYQNDRVNALPGHNMGFATLGCLILWIGWFGFNPGSELAASPNVPYIAVTTNLAAAAGGMTSTFTSWIKDGKPDLSMTINGILAGLVGITAGCADVGYFSAVIIGAIAGIIVVFSVGFFDSVLKIDDPVGATSVHLVCGIWGTLAVGIFGTGNFGTQLLGVVAVGAFTVAFSAIVWTILKVTIGIRVGEHEEMQGLDIGEHGMEAYSGFVKEADIISGGGASAGIGMSEMSGSSDF